MWRRSTSRLDERCSALRISDRRRWRSSVISSAKAPSSSSRLCRIFIRTKASPIRRYITSPPRLSGAVLGDQALGSLVDLDEAQVVLGDLLGGAGALEISVQIALERRPTRSSGRWQSRRSRRPGRPGASQWSTLSSSAPRPSSTQTTPVAAARARLLDEHLAVGALVDALDLPDVHLDAGVLDRRRSRGASARGAARRHSARSSPPTDSSWCSLGRHQQLEQELAVVLVQPVGQPLELVQLLAVGVGVALRVVADEHLGEVGIEASRCARRSPRRTRSRTCSGRSSRPASRASGRSSRPRRARRRRTARRRARRSRRACAPRSTARSMPSKIRCLASAIVAGLLGGRVALDPEHLLLERAAVVEGQDVQLAVVTQFHDEVLRRCR